jgi:hypothetical protein
MFEFAGGAADEGIRLGLLATMFGYGLRHGIDWDHIAAITDLTGSQNDGRRSIFLATIYALGHAAVVFALGVTAVVAGGFLPSALDVAMEKVVGATLLLLGGYVFYSLVRDGRDFRMRSRWMLLFAGVQRGTRWLRTAVHRRDIVEIVHEHAHPVDGSHGHGHRDSLSGTGRLAVATKTHTHLHAHHGRLPQDPFASYSWMTALTVGMVHGIGAETPTQVVLFLTAAGTHGDALGVLLLCVFLAGLLVSNSLVAISATYGYLSASRNFGVYVGIAVATGLFSLVLGTLYVIGRGSVVPALL